MLEQDDGDNFESGEQRWQSYRETTRALKADGLLFVADDLPTPRRINTMAAKSRAERLRQLRAQGSRDKQD